MKLLIFILTWLIAVAPNLLEAGLCRAMFNKGPRGTLEECDKLESGITENGHYYSKKYTNLLLLTDAHCRNDGSFICKGLAGRFEFLFNTKTRKVLGPVPKSEFVDENGFHQRVPVAYNINGEVFYVDRTINWATGLISKGGLSNPINLLDISKFNWCLYAPNDLWPYKSAVLSPDKKYHIYFYNRQSCIYEPRNKRRQHFNTRFLHNSSLRLDLDMNPTIFDMEEHHDNSIRLIKHHRQHWFESKFRVLEGVGNLNYFIEMDDQEEPPISLKDGLLLDHTSYDKFSDLCLDDYYSTRVDKNAHMAPGSCGADYVEIADLPEPVWRAEGGAKKPYEVHLHNIPRWPVETERFYGVNVSEDKDWMRFASDGLAFTATTTIPKSGDIDTVKVISLYVEYSKSGPKDRYDENYPYSVLSIYDAKYSPGSKTWSFDRESHAERNVNLNPVDDIAYLPSCGTVLVIFGPLYQEIPADNFGLKYTSRVGSIYDLSIYEQAHAFFAHPDPGQSTLFVYHRQNWIQALNYKCGADGRLVTMTKMGKYTPRTGIGKLSLFATDIDATRVHSEEEFFKDLGVYKGESSTPDAPDPRSFPTPNVKIELPEETSYLYLYIIVGVALILVLIMCAACLLTMRRRHKSLFQVHTHDNFGGRTMRSGLMSSTHSSQAGTVRANLSKSSNLNSAASSKTRRSEALIPRSSPRSPPRSPSRSPSSATSKSKQVSTKGSTTSRRSSPH